MAPGLFRAPRFPSMPVSAASVRVPASHASSGVVPRPFLGSTLFAPPLSEARTKPNDSPYATRKATVSA